MSYIFNYVDIESKEMKILIKLVLDSVTTKNATNK